MSSPQYVPFVASAPLHDALRPRLRDSNPNEQMLLSIYMKPRGVNTDATPEILVRETMEQMIARRTIDHRDDVRLIEQFAFAHGLQVTSIEPGRRLIQLTGSVADVGAAFGTTIGVYRDGESEFRSHDQPLNIPDELVPVVESVLGIDNRRMVHRSKGRSAVSTAGPDDNQAMVIAGGKSSPTVGSYYGFPTDFDGTGQCIVLIEIGGGYLPSDTSLYANALQLTAPTVVSVSIDGAANNYVGLTNTTDTATLNEIKNSEETALDIQVAFGVAPAARIAVYATDGTNQHVIDAITFATTDVTNRPTVISMSFGALETSWNAASAPAGQLTSSLNSALRSAAGVGITCFAASGDTLADVDPGSGIAQVNVPASSPWVIGVGGTTVDANGSLVVNEVVWSNPATATNPAQGTGGGISIVYPVPSFQSSANIPPLVNHPQNSGRGVPDVCANADPNSGYLIYYGGHSYNTGGTSAACPLWAGLAALMNQSAGHPLGFFLPTLYKHPALLKNITQGNNMVTVTGYANPIGYSAGPGWNACTGLGSPIGAALMSAVPFAAAPLSRMAAVNVGSGQIRLYYLDTANWIREQCFNGTSWSPGASFGPALAGTSIGAVTWGSGSATNIRVYYQNAQNQIQEECYINGAWASGPILPTAVAAPKTGIAVIEWASGNQLRVYYQTTSNVIQEMTYDGAWVTGTTLGSAAPGTQIASVLWLSGGAVNVRLYYQTANNSIQEECCGNSGWSMGTTLPVAAPGSGLGAIQWIDSSQHIRLYFETPANILQEYCWDGCGWVSGTTFCPVAPGGALASTSSGSGSSLQVWTYYQSTGNLLREKTCGASWTDGSLSVLTQ